MKRPATTLAASAAAIVAAALTPGLALFVSSRANPNAIGVMLLLFIPGALLAALHLLVLGLPLYLYQDKCGRVGWARAGVSGFVVGAFPLPLLLVLDQPDAHPADFLGVVLWFGGAGLAGGLAFRAIYGPSEPPP